MNRQKFENPHGKYPVSSETLDFIQDQIMMAASLANFAGENVIFKNSTSNTEGVVIVKGEIMPLKGTPQAWITVKEELSSVVALGENFENVRINRYAVYTSIQNENESYAASTFKPFEVLISTQEKLDYLRRTALPIGTVIDWYGTGSLADQLPEGWVPCGKFYATPNQDAALEERNKWRARYPNNLSIAYYYDGGHFYYVMATQANGVVVPDLTDSYVVQAGMHNQVGQVFDAYTSLSGSPTENGQFAKAALGEGYSVAVLWPKSVALYKLIKFL